MKCISLWQPWATLVVIGAKKFETRSWAANYSGPLLIHAAKKRDADSIALMTTEPFYSVFAHQMRAEMPFGAIIGMVRLVECLRMSGDEPGAFVLSDGTRVTGNERYFGDFSKGRHAWRLINAVRFESPIPYRGMQQIFDVPDEVVGLELEKLEARG